MKAWFVSESIEWYNDIMKMKRLNLVLASVWLNGCYSVGLMPGVKPVEIHDDIPPYINLQTYEFTTSVGKPIDFSTVTGYDDIDGLLPVTVIGTIDYDRVGEYYPSLSCVDYQGNEAKVQLVVRVTDEVQETGETAEPAKTPDERPAEPAGCDAFGAKDASLGCEMVLSEDLEEYDLVFQGEEGEAQCLSTIGEDEKEMCRAIYANDGRLWGYGRLKNGAEESE